MNTKQKLNISNIVNICFFLFALIFLVNQLYGLPVIGTTSYDINDLIYLFSTYLSILLGIIFLYLVPGLIIIEHSLFIQLRVKLDFKEKSLNINVLKKYINTSHKMICVYRC